MEQICCMCSSYQHCNVGYKRYSLNYSAKIYSRKCDLCLFNNKNATPFGGQKPLKPPNQTLPLGPIERGHGPLNLTYSLSTYDASA